MACDVQWQIFWKRYIHNNIEFEINSIQRRHIQYSTLPFPIYYHELAVNITIVL